MDFPRTYTLKEISRLIDCKYIGREDFPIIGINEIHVVRNGDIVFVDHPKYYDKALNSEASVILINKEVESPTGKALLISDDPFRDFNKLTKHFQPFKSSSKLIADSAKIGDDTIIQPNCFIGNNAVIGNRCIIHPNVIIYDDCIIGDNVTIHSGTVLGASAFYYKKRPEGYDQLISGGRVVIEDNVDIGALCTIDRGVTADTTIGKGSKLDNQVQIGHDTIIGKNCLIAAQTAVAGCVVIEDDVTIWGQVGIKSGITIKSKAVISAQSGVGRTLEGNTSYFGSPADESRVKFREMSYIKQIPDILRELKKLKDESEGNR